MVPGANGADRSGDATVIDFTHASTWLGRIFRRSMSANVADRTASDIAFRGCPRSSAASRDSLGHLNSLSKSFESRSRPDTGRGNPPVASGVLWLLPNVPLAG